ncbi:MAG: hypothetical protein ABH891_00010 [Candidatus Omnitrophota bacterium]
MSSAGEQSYVRRELDPLAKITHNKNFVTALVANGLDGMKVRKILADRHLSTENQVFTMQPAKRNLSYARRWLANLYKNDWLLPEEKREIEKIRGRLDGWHERMKGAGRRAWESMCKNDGIDPSLTANYRIGKVIYDLHRLIDEFIPRAADDKSDRCYPQRKAHELIAELLNNKKAKSPEHFGWLPTFTEKTVKRYYDNYFQNKSK